MPLRPPEQISGGGSCSLTTPRIPRFYLGQLHALAGVASLIRHQSLPREAVQLEKRSIGPNELEKQLNPGFAESGSSS